MSNILVKGTEKVDYDFAAGDTLQINLTAESYTITENCIVSGRIQLGAGAGVLAGGERLQIDISITNTETGDVCLMPPYVVVVPAGRDFMLMAFQPFHALVNDVITIDVTSNDSADNSVGASVEMALLGILS